jgi:hypothetical protein
MGALLVLSALPTSMVVIRRKVAPFLNIDRVLIGWAGMRNSN